MCCRGSGPTATLALLLPLTFHLSPVSAIIMLAGICYGATYGGSTTSILLNIPGEASSVVTCLDGYQMARKGRAGPALGISAFGSFIAGTFSIFGLVLFAPTLADAGAPVRPPGVFRTDGHGDEGGHLPRAADSVVKALMMCAIGIVLGCVGLDPITATPRLTMGLPELMDGVGLAPVVMGLFGISEVLLNAGMLEKAQVFEGKIRGLLPEPGGLEEIDGTDRPRHAVRVHARDHARGGDDCAAVSRATPWKRGSPPTRSGSGKGAIEGVASPEACNNAAMGGTFIPLFSLGHSVQCHHRGAAGRLDDLRTHPGTAPHPELPRISSGGSSPACTSAMSVFSS